MFVYRLAQTTALRMSLVENLKDAVEATLNAEERATKVEEILNLEEKRQDSMRIDLKLLEELLYKKGKELTDAKASEKMIEASINVIKKYF